ncbi:hypothetical protein GCM10009550_34670 [Actinocorallia libanotica]|uniref:TPM domain-containing protein n=2 Tax=Actinocorallia libanotica TaxID=46162 RepID=A0ABN1R7R4_9ACTN
MDFAVRGGAAGLDSLPVRRFLGFLAAMSLFVWFCSAPAWADREKSNADLLAERLAEKPVLVTDHELREIPEGTAERLEQALSGLGVPYFVVVRSSGIHFDERKTPDELAVLLHERLQKDGIYLVTDARGSGTARQYGGSWPVERAWGVAGRELSYDAGVAQQVERFVEILRAPDVEARLKEVREAPESAYAKRSRERDRAEMRALVLGSVLGAAVVLVPLCVSLVRKRVRR